MNSLFVLFLLACTEAQKGRQRLNDVDQYPDHFNSSVPFGHVYKSKLNRNPVDTLDQELALPKRSKSNFLRTYGRPKTFTNARDEYKYYKDRGEDNDDDKLRTWLDLPLIQSRNVMEPSRLKMIKKPKVDLLGVNETEVNKPKQMKSKAANERNLKMNWTTCDELGHKANFHPREIVNMDWVPFFTWSEGKIGPAIVHRFTLPTQKLVKAYRDGFGPHLINFDWEQPKLRLFMDDEYLLIAADRKGLFHLLPETEFPEHVKDKVVKVPKSIIRLKIEDPYLVIMWCDGLHYASIMAVSGEEPTNDDEKTLEAKTIDFRGTGKPVSRDPDSENLRALILKLNKKSIDDMNRQTKEHRKEDDNDEIGKFKGYE